MEKKHAKIYEKAKYYDIAFSYRNYYDEIHFLKRVYQTISQKPLYRILELAAGPAGHALAFAHEKIESHALDLSSAMKDYALEQAQHQNVALKYHIQDMTHFEIKTQFELIFMMIDSLAYILTGEDLLRHLYHVANHLSPGGIYIIEASHPRDFLTPKPTVNTSWSIEKDKIKVEMNWGDKEKDRHDPIAQIHQTHVTMNVQDQDRSYQFQEIAKQRYYTYQELLSWFGQIHELSWKTCYGAFNLNTQVTSNDAWRMIHVLQKTP